MNVDNRNVDDRPLEPQVTKAGAGQPQIRKPADQKTQKLVEKTLAQSQDPEVSTPHATASSPAGSPVNVNIQELQSQQAGKAPQAPLVTAHRLPELPHQKMAQELGELMRANNVEEAIEKIPYFLDECHRAGVEPLALIDEELRRAVQLLALNGCLLRALSGRRDVLDLKLALFELLFRTPKEYILTLEEVLKDTLKGYLTQKPQIAYSFMQIWNQAVGHPALKGLAASALMSLRNSPNVHSQVLERAKNVALAYRQNMMIQAVQTDDVREFEKHALACIRDGIPPNWIFMNYSSITGVQIPKDSQNRLQRWTLRLELNLAVKSGALARVASMLTPKEIKRLEEAHGTGDELRETILNELQQHFVTALVKFDRESLYSFFQKWLETFKDIPEIQLLAMSALESAMKDRDPAVQKGAQNVFMAYYQEVMVDALNRDDMNGFEKLARACLTKDIPLRKMVKDYQVTTKTMLAPHYIEMLERELLRLEIKDALTANDSERVKVLMKQVAMNMKGNTAAINIYMKRTGIKDDLYTSLSAFFEHTNQLLNTFKGQQGSLSVQELSAKAKEASLTIPELYNFAIDLYESMGLLPTESTKAAWELVRAEGAEKLPALAETLYRALVANERQAVRSVMEEVNRLGFAKQFSWWLNAEKEKAASTPSSKGKEIADRVVAIYDAMSKLPVSKHNMSPFELVKSAIIAERHFREGGALESQAKLEKAAELVSGGGVRTHIVDLRSREISFLSKSKGGKLYAFGGFKKVTSAVTITLGFQGTKALILASITTEAVPKKSALFYGDPARRRREWDEEVEVLRTYRGVQGVVSCTTVVDYTRRAGAKVHARYAILMPDYDAGDFSDVKERNPKAIEPFIGYYLGVAIGLKNLHHFQEEQPDKTRKNAPRMHGDLKPPNLLAATDGRSAIGDFGFQISLNKQEFSVPFHWPMYGTVGYTDPHLPLLVLSVEREGRSNEEAAMLLKEALKGIDPLTLDCFAMGVSIYESIHGDIPKELRYQDKMKKTPLTKAQALEASDKFDEAYAKAVKNLDSIPNPTLEQQFERIAWKLMNPNLKERMTSEQFVEAMQVLKARLPV